MTCVQPSTGRVFLGTVISNQSLAAALEVSDDDSCGSAYESGDDVHVEYSEGSGSDDDDVEDLEVEIEKLNITCNDQFIEHQSENTNDDTEMTQIECVDMELSSLTADHNY